MRLGFDFDNTLISYDRLFHRIAQDKALIPETTLPQKNAVRDHLRQQGAEDEWTCMQGEVYGGRILEAEPYPGMHATLRAMQVKRIPMCIVSHKTRTPYLGQPWDLHAAALGWLRQQGFFDAQGLGWSEDQIFFELTKEAKVARILALGCTHYVDDLPEILEMLPDSVEKVLFDPGKVHSTVPAWKRLSAWGELSSLLGL